MFTIRPILSMSFTTAAAVLCTAMQLAAIDSLTEQRVTATSVTHLPPVVVTARRDIAPDVVHQLPPVLVTSRREASPVTVHHLPPVVVISRRAGSDMIAAKAAVRSAS